MFVLIELPAVPFFNPSIWGGYTRDCGSIRINTFIVKKLFSCRSSVCFGYTFTLNSSSKQPNYF
ncbi:unnamed protein product [Meloidogyne enterolobii]|uniref:Uncharacterized protein n=1 Tax=Meloidogyne enterolobii TaxID=390850 RepID=A0ACB0XYJ8_MELEN